MTESRFERSFVIMLSARAAKLLGVNTRELPSVTDLSKEGHWFATWRCEVMASHSESRTNYFLLTNARTLFSLVVSNRDGNSESLVCDFATTLYNIVATAGHSIPPARTGSFSLVKGQARSLIGSQNELIRCNLDRFHEQGASLESITRSLNMTVMMTIKGFPDDEFSAALKLDPPFPENTEPPLNLIPFNPDN